jgi:HSP20 family protein
MNQSTVISPDSQRGRTAKAAGNGNYQQASDHADVQGGELQTSGDGASEVRTTGEQARLLIPPVDIVEDETGITVWADLPGVPRDRLGIKVTGDNLVIEGVSAVPANADMELLYGEVQSPHYRRSFTLSRELDPGKIDAKLANGVLRLRIPKAEEARPRRIEVSVG